MAYPHPLLIDLARGEAVREPMDPGMLATSAVEHRMTGLLRTRVAAGELVLDEPAREELLQRELVIRAQSRRLRQALSEIWTRTGSIGVELATFKGPTAAARWYDRDGERPSADLDLLIGPADLPRAEEIASLIEPGHRLTGMLQRVVDHRELQSVDLTLGNVAIDLHFDVLKFEVPSRSLELVWSRTARYTLVNGVETRVLDAETALVHLLLHLNKDRFRYLLGYVDIAHLIAREELDWDFVFELMRLEGLEVPLTLTLEVIAELLGLELPPHARPRGWRASVWRRLWNEDVRLQGQFGLMKYRNRQRTLPMMARGRAREGLLRWVRYLAPPPELMDYHFPDTSGAYWRRNVEGRIRHFVGRRRATERLIEGDLPGPRHGTGPNTGVG